MRISSPEVEILLVETNEQVRELGARLRFWRIACIILLLIEIALAALIMAMVTI